MQWCHWAVCWARHCSSPGSGGVGGYPVYGVPGMVRTLVVPGGTGPGPVPAVIPHCNPTVNHCSATVTHCNPLFGHCIPTVWPLNPRWWFPESPRWWFPESPRWWPGEGPVVTRPGLSGWRFARSMDLCSLRLSVRPLTKTSIRSELT